MSERLFGEEILRMFHGDEFVDAYIERERQKAADETNERERIVMEQWRIAEQTGTLHLMLPPDEL